MRQHVEGEHLYEIVYHLRRNFWGQGLATEAAARLISLVRPENQPSRRVAERVGMTIWKEVNWGSVQHIVYSIEKPK